MEAVYQLHIPQQFDYCCKHFLVIWASPRGMCFTLEWWIMMKSDEYIIHLRWVAWYKILEWNYLLSGQSYSNHRLMEWHSTVHRGIHWRAIHSIVRGNNWRRSGRQSQPEWTSSLHTRLPSVSYCSKVIRLHLQNGSIASFIIGADVLISVANSLTMSGHLDLFEPVERWGCRYLLEKVQNAFSYSKFHHGIVSWLSR